MGKSDLREGPDGGTQRVNAQLRRLNEERFISSNSVNLLNSCGWLVLSASAQYVGLS